MTRRFIVAVGMGLAIGWGGLELAMGGDDVHLYHGMNAQQLAEAIRECPVAYYPTGINEWHGEQSAVGLDALKAESLAQLASTHLGGVCLPVNWVGPGGSTPFDPEKNPRGTVTIDRTLYEQGARHVLDTLESMGFQVAVYLSGHYPCEIHEIAEEYNARGGMRVISVTENELAEGVPAGDHAGSWETTMLHVLRPGLVDLSKLPPLPAGVKHAGEVIPPRWHFRQRCEYYGIYGSDPRIWVNDHYGREGVKAFLGGLGRRVAEALGQPDFGKGPFDVTWPKRDLDPDEVRYDRLLPYQWIDRFAKAPIVYWPLPAMGPEMEGVTEAAVEAAKQTGGMVFPAFPYGPTEEQQPLSFQNEMFIPMVREVVATLAEMDFRLVVLLVDEELSSEAFQAIKKLKAESDQYRLLVVRTNDGKMAQHVVREASVVIPPSDAISKIIDGQWTINGRRSIRALSENPYGPSDVRIYEITFQLTEDEASRKAVLDLGEVHNHGEVMLNGSEGMTDHWPSYRFVVTGKLKTGENTLKVLVHHRPQPTLDHWFYRPRLPQMTGPVTLHLW